MIFLAWLVTLQFLVLHTLDGRDVYINPTFVVTLGEARDQHDPHKLLTGKVGCVVGLLDGKFITVTEDCDKVRERMQE